MHGFHCLTIALSARSVASHPRLASIRIASHPTFWLRAGLMQDKPSDTDATKVVYRLPQPSYHVWTVADMQILDELHNPVAIAIYGTFENPHRCKMKPYTAYMGNRP